MSPPQPVRIPLLNPNEPDALVTAVLVEDGQRVTQGEPLCTLETTKAAHELLADAPGYVLGLCCQAGETVTAGEVFCYLAASPDQSLPEAPPPGTESPPEGEPLPPGLRITRPALRLARERGIDLAALPIGPLVTADRVRSALEAGDLPPAGPGAFDPRALVVYGGGGHGKAVIELARARGGFRLVGVIDDGIPAGEAVLDVPVLGGGERLADLFEGGVRLAANAVGGIGDITSRVRVFHRLAESGFGCPVLIHPSAVIEPSARLSAGTQVFPHAYVGSDARLGRGVIVNTGAIVSHDCEVQVYANLSPGAILAGGVRVGPRSLIGMGATVNLGVSVGADARVGNGATVKEDVPAGGVVPAGSIWPRR